MDCSIRCIWSTVLARKLSSLWNWAKQVEIVVCPGIASAVQSFSIHTLLSQSGFSVWLCLLHSIGQCHCNLYISLEVVMLAISVAFCKHMFTAQRLVDRKVVFCCSTVFAAFELISRSSNSCTYIYISVLCERMHQSIFPSSQVFATLGHLRQAL